MKRAQLFVCLSSVAACTAFGTTGEKVDGGPIVSTPDAAPPPDVDAGVVPVDGAPDVDGSFLDDGLGRCGGALLRDDFERADLTQGWDVFKTEGAGFTVTPTTESPRTGARAMRVLVQGSNNVRRWYGRRNWSTPPTCIDVWVWLRVTEPASGDGTIIVVSLDMEAVSKTAIQVTLSRDGLGLQEQSFPGPETRAIGPKLPFSTGPWRRIHLRFDEVAMRVGIAVDGVGTSYTPGFTHQGATASHVGMPFAHKDVSATYFLDDVAITQ